MAYSVVLRICSSYRILSLLLHDDFPRQMVDTLFSLSKSNTAWTVTQLSHLRLHGLCAQPPP